MTKIEQAKKLADPLKKKNGKPEMSSEAVKIGIREYGAKTGRITSAVRGSYSNAAGDPCSGRCFSVYFYSCVEQWA